MTRLAVRISFALLLPALLLFCLCGCAWRPLRMGGVEASELVYRGVQLNVTTKDELIALFGEPLKIEPSIMEHTEYYYTDASYTLDPAQIVTAICIPSGITAWPQELYPAVRGVQLGDDIELVREKFSGLWGTYNNEEADFDEAEMMLYDVLDYTYTGVNGVVVTTLDIRANDPAPLHAEVAQLMIQAEDGRVTLIHYGTGYLTMVRIYELDPIDSAPVVLED